MSAKDRPVSKPATDEYLCNYERIFRKTPEDQKPQEPAKQPEGEKKCANS